MFRFLFRFLGLVLLTLGFLVLVHDGTKSIADQTVYITKVGPAWEYIHQNSLKALEPIVERRSPGRGLGTTSSNPIFSTNRLRSSSPSSVVF
jgi:hypothetical protein